jgi:adenylate cyclase
MFSFERGESGEWLQELKTPLPHFTEAAAGIGFINMPAEKGNIVRRVTVIDTNFFGRPYPSFSLASILAATGLSPDDLKLTGRTLQAGEIDVPVNEINQVLIDFWGPGGTFPTYSYIDVLEGRFDPDFWKGKIVLIGVATPTEKGDYYENPFTRGNLVLSEALPAPGVEIHASAIKTYLTGRYYHRARWPVNLIVLVISWLLTIFAARRGAWVGFGSAFLVAAGLSFCAYIAWLKFHYWVNLAGPLIMVFLTYTEVTVENFVRAELERRRIRTVFGRYVPPAVVERLIAEGENIKLGGEKQEVTVLFSDIRGFTAYSEGKPPEKVVSRLNEYFTAMTAVVFRHGGTLDKFLGDGLMAVFGVPIPYPDHARRAVVTAIEMLERLEELNQDWKSRGEETMEIGIGINSGEVVVGNIGSPERMDYTVIGEEVNLASRLEGMNKKYNTRIIISERTARLLQESDLPEPWSLVELGEAKVRGLTEPVKIYTLTKN